MNKVGFKLVIMISIAVLLSVFSTGGIGYLISRRIIEKDVKDVKLKTLVELKATKAEKVIHRGIEISRSLAQDTTLNRWFAGREKDELLGEAVKQKLNFIVNELSYSTAFAASKYTRHFWTDGNRLVDVLTETDPDDSWFFDFLNKHVPVEINVEHNRELNNVSVWINALMGPIDDPHGVAGVGLPLEETSREVTENPFGKYGKVWMIDTNGRIQIDERPENIGRPIDEFVSAAALAALLSDPADNSLHTYENEENEEIILAMHRIEGTDSAMIIRILKTRWLWSILNPFFHGVFYTALIVLALFSSIFAFLSIINTKILTRLSNAILALGEEQFDGKDLYNDDLSRRDEFGDIARGYETTRGKLYIAYQNLKALNATFEHFVPKQFLNRIAKDGVEKIRLGEAECDTLAILFADIRSFTNLSEKMPPQDVLNFLNAYFREMNVPINENHGFVDKFIGDAIMALFDRQEGSKQNNAKDAVRAAIGMQKALLEFNRQQHQAGYPPVSIGIGIHSGSVVIGTVGAEDRMDSTVLGDAVNMASRLESLTKHYQAQIIISSQIYRQLEDDPSFLVRELDFVAVKGKKTPEVVFEVFNCSPADIIELKKKLLPMYKKGMDHFHMKQWKEAALCFEKCLEIYPDDAASRRYVDRCLKFQQHPPSPTWDGATHLDRK